MPTRRFPSWDIALLLSVFSALATFRLGGLLVKYLATTELTASTKTVLTPPILTPVAPIDVDLAATMNIITFALAGVGTVAWAFWLHRSPHANLSAPPKPTDRLLIPEGLAKAAGIGILIAAALLISLAIFHTDVVDRWATANQFWELAGHIFAMTIGLTTLFGVLYSPLLWFLGRLYKRKCAQVPPADEA